MGKVEIVELGYPQSIIQRENEPITELIETELLVQQLESRIKELEDNQTTELIHRTGDLTHDFWYFCQECGENFEMDHGFNFCPNCGRKIIRK